MPCHLLCSEEYGRCQKVTRDDGCWGVNVCGHVIRSAFMCGKEESFQRFSFLSLFLTDPLHSAPKHTCTPQSWRQRVWPCQEPTHQSPSSSSEVCLFPPLAECHLNPAHTCTHSYSRICPYTVCWCLLVSVTGLGSKEWCILCACKCRNVCVTEFGSSFNAALPKNPQGNVVWTPPLFFFSFSPSLSVPLSQLLSLFCFSVNELTFSSYKPVRNLFLFLLLLFDKLHICQHIVTFHSV